MTKKGECNSVGSGSGHVGVGDASLHCVPGETKVISGKRDFWSRSSTC
jgi:hypothetical protein